MAIFTMRGRRRYIFGNTRISELDLTRATLCLSKYSIGTATVVVCVEWFSILQSRVTISAIRSYRFQ